MYSLTEKGAACLETANLELKILDEIYSAEEMKKLKVNAKARIN